MLCHLALTAVLLASGSYHTAGIRVLDYQGLALPQPAVEARNLVMTMTVTQIVLIVNNSSPNKFNT